MRHIILSFLNNFSVDFLEIADALARMQLVLVVVFG